MTPAINRKQITPDWYDDVCQQLDHLQATAAKYADKDESIPSDRLFSDVKQQLKDLRRRLGFSRLRLPDVCLSRNGDICLTWDAGKKSFDLVFGSKFTARLSTGLTQKVLEPKDIPSALRQFAN